MTTSVTGSSRTKFLAAPLTHTFLSERFETALEAEPQDYRHTVYLTL